MQPTRVVAVCGSRRDGSKTRLALGHALDAADAAGADVALLDLGEWDLPVYDPNLDDDPDVVVEFTSEVRDSDAVILGSPVYHGSYSSTLKTAMDWCGYDEFREKTVGLLTVAGGSTFESTLDHMRAVARGVDAWVLPHQAGVPNASEKFDEDGEFVDESLAERVERLGRDAVRYANIQPRSRQALAHTD